MMVRADVTLIQNGDEWEYWFEVADDQAEYYGWEESVPKGYQVDGKGTRENPATSMVTETSYSHTKNIDEEGNRNGDYERNQNTKDTVTIPGASSLHVKITYATQANYDWVCIWEGEGYQPSEYYANLSITGKLTGTTMTTKEYTIKGDTATFGFHSDGAFGYWYGYYAVITADVPGEGELSITNKVPSYQEEDYGSLKLSKVVDGNGADPTQNFRFDLQLHTENQTLKEKLKGISTYGDVTFTDGKGMVYLEHGESVTMSGIPVGVNWEIAETPTDGYTTKINGGTPVEGKSNTVTGQITKDQTSEIVYTNTKNSGGDEPGPTETGSFKVKKVVENGSDSDEFVFFATLTGLGKNSTYPISVARADGTNETQSVQSNIAGSASLSFTLKDRDTAEFQKLPAGAKYQVREEASAYTASYRITDEEDASRLHVVMDRGQNLEADKALATQRETLDAGEKALITFTNSKPAPAAGTVNIVVRKIWEDNNDAAGIRPDTVIVQLYQSTDASEQGNMIAIAQLDEQSNWEAEFQGLEERTENGQKEYVYTVQEEPVAGYQGEITKKSDGNFEITNHISVEEKAELTIKKMVQGNAGSQTEEFSFELTLTSPDDRTVPDRLKCEKDGKSVTLVKKDGVYSFTLAHGEEISIGDIPAGAAYEIRETGAKEQGYTVICDNLTGHVAQDTEVLVVNEKNVNNKPQNDKKDKPSHGGGSGSSGTSGSEDGGSISNTQNPKTGDSAPIGLLVSLIVLSAGMLVILNKIRRNKQK
ncbi:MAG: Cna B-type domain-containing protein [Lachnospiraceae bacterium]